MPGPEQSSGNQLQQCAQRVVNGVLEEYYDARHDLGGNPATGMGDISSNQY